MNRDETNRLINELIDATENGKQVWSGLAYFTTTYKNHKFNLYSGGRRNTLEVDGVVISNQSLGLIRLRRIIKKKMSKSASASKADFLVTPAKDFGYRNE